MHKYTSGHYRQQQEYKSFTPSFINHQIAWVNPQIDVLIEQSAKLLGELNTYTFIGQDVDFFIPLNIAKEATYSNQNYIDAMNYAISRLPELPLSMRLLKDVHKISMSGVRGKHKAPGEIRRSQNWIGGSSLSNAIFIPPSPEEVPDLLSDLEKFWHNKSLQLPIPSPIILDLVEAVCNE